MKTKVILIIITLFILAYGAYGAFYFLNNKTIECGPCAQFIPPSPNFCEGRGEIVSGGVNKCGCQLPPKCSEDNIPFRQDQESDVVIVPQEKAGSINTPGAILSRLQERFPGAFRDRDFEIFEWRINDGQYAGTAAGEVIQAYQLSLQDLDFGEQSVLYRLESTLNNFFIIEGGLEPSPDNTYEGSTNGRSIVSFEDTDEGIACMREIVDHGAEYIGYKIYCGCTPDDLPESIPNVGDIFGSLTVSSVDIKSACWNYGYKGYEYIISLEGNIVVTGTIGGYNDILGGYDFEMSNKDMENLPPSPFRSQTFNLQGDSQGVVYDVLSNISSGEEISVEIDGIRLISRPTEVMSKINVIKVIR